MNTSASLTIVTRLTSCLVSTQISVVLPGIEGIVKFVEQARFPQPRFADNAHDLSVSLFRPLQARIQQPALLLATYERRQPAFRADLQPAAPASSPDNLVHVDRYALSFHFDGPQ